MLIPKSDTYKANQHFLLEIGIKELSAMLNLPVNSLGDWLRRNEISYLVGINKITMGVYSILKAIRPSSVAMERTDMVAEQTRSLKIEWLNSNEAAELLRLSVKALRNLTSNGQLPFYKLGRRNRYRRDELEAILLKEKRGQ